MLANDDRNEPHKPGETLKALGVQLPPPPTSLGNYVETSFVGSLLFTSGILPFVDGKLLFTGRLGADLTVEQGQEAARYAALNALAAASHFLGNVDHIRKVVRVGMALATTETFTQHAAVANGASDLFTQIFGIEKGTADAQCTPRPAPQKASASSRSTETFTRWVLTGCCIYTIIETRMLYIYYNGDQDEEH